MTALTWGEVGVKRFETGVDRGVLFIPDNNGNYAMGYAWNGLTTVTESPSGAEPNKQWADNGIYANLISLEEFMATIEAFTYPTAFEACDGSAVPSAGVSIGQQSRQTFGFAYRTRIGNDVQMKLGYKLHLVYGCLAAPSEKAHATVNDSPEAMTFSWEVSTTPVQVTGMDPTATITIDSTKVDPTKLAALELVLYGSGALDPRLPLPDEVISIVGTTLTAVRLTNANAPTYNSGTHIITLPTVTGIQWKINGVNKTPGAQPALATGEVKTVTAVALAGYTITSDADWTFDY